MGEDEGWRKYFTVRERKEIAFDHLYARTFNHGTDGHNMRIIIAKFAELLDGTVALHGTSDAIAPLTAFELPEVRPNI